MYAIFKREVKAYFYQPIAYVLIGLFMLLTAIFCFMFNNLYSQSADFSPGLSTMGFFLTIIIPILTMKTLAEERKNGTEILLITSPSSLTSIVVGKYLAALFVFLVMTVLTFIYPIIILIFGGHITAQLIGGYVGFILMGAAFVSIGVFASSLTENQVIAAVISIVSLLIMLVIESLTQVFGGIIAKILNWISLYSRNNDFTVGIFGLSPVIYYLSFTAVMLFLTVRVIEKRRWSQG